MPTDTQTLEALSIFKDLAPDEKELIAEKFHHMRVTEGEILIRKGQPAQTFYIVLSGNYMIAYPEDRALTLHNRGDIMGWSTVITPFRYRGTAVALTDGEVLSMPGDEFLELIQGNAALSDKIMRVINDVVARRMPLISASETGEQS